MSKRINVVKDRIELVEGGILRIKLDTLILSRDKLSGEISKELKKYRIIPHFWRNFLGSYICARPRRLLYVAELNSFGYTPSRSRYRVDVCVTTRRKVAKDIQSSRGSGSGHLFVFLFNQKDQVWYLHGIEFKGIGLDGYNGYCAICDNGTESLEGWTSC